MPDPILLAEDDPITREVLASHLQGLRLSCQAFDSCRGVERALRERRYAALILDLNLRGGTGTELLCALRADADSPNQQSPALAISADLRPEQRQQLQDCGFGAALQKPVSLQNLRTALLALGLDLGPAASPVAKASAAGRALVLDDAQALSACGSQKTVAGLRSLLAAELPGHEAQIRSALAAEDQESLRDCVHKLRSALGFCGGSELLELLSRLPPGLPQPEQMAPIWIAFERLARALRETVESGVRAS